MFMISYVDYIVYLYFMVGLYVKVVGDIGI